MLTFEETRHATTATVVIEGSAFDEKEVVDIVASKTQFRELIESILLSCVLNYHQVGGFFHTEAYCIYGTFDLYVTG